MKWMSLILHKLWKIKFRIVTSLGGKTLGARALVISNNHEILLIRHTYSQGWYTIGGAVESGETPVQAIIRELKEEVGITVLESPRLQAVYYSNNEGRDDYVMLYIVEKMNEQNSYCPEIAEKRWFSFKELPADISPATLRRIEEFLGLREIKEIW
jgi:mutator protein MutT